jgi:hypothetical protein
MVTDNANGDADMKNEIKKELEMLGLTNFDSAMKIQNNMNLYLETREMVAKKLEHREDAVFNGAFKQVVAAL